MAVSTAPDWKAPGVKLPSPTRDYVEARRNLAEWGYCIVADALDTATLAAMRARLVEQAAAERRDGVAYLEYGDANQRVWMLVNKGQVFRDLVLHPVVEELMPDMLGPDYILSSLTANIAGPGGRPMDLHQDQAMMSFWTPVPVVTNVLWMMDDFVDANGATRIVPGSHLREVAVGWNVGDEVETMAAEAPAGSAFVFDGRLWHGTGTNRTGAPRHAILSYYCRPFFRQQENIFLGGDEAVIAAQSPEWRARMGYKVHSSLGHVGQGGKRGFIDLVERVPHPIGELR